MANKYYNIGPTFYGSCYKTFLMLFKPLEVKLLLTYTDIVVKYNRKWFIR